MSICLLFGGLILAFLLGGSVLYGLISLSHKYHLYDCPGDRKIHSTPVPRIGGVSFLPTLVAVVFLFVQFDIIEFAGNRHLMFGVGLVIVYFTGLIDDVFSLNYQIKFASQILTAMLLCFGGLRFPLGEYLGDLSIPEEFQIIVSVLFVVYVTDAINLIDGIDGLASGLSLIGFTLLSCLFWRVDCLFESFCCISITGVLLIFFLFNVFGTKKKTFMGDCGSLTLGFCFAYYIMLYYQNSELSCFDEYAGTIVPLGAIMLPLLDVIRVFWERICHKKDPFLPDKRHIHHLLLECGFAPRFVLIVLLVFTLLNVMINSAFCSCINSFFVLFIDIAIYVILVICIYRRKFLYKMRQ